MDFLKLELDCLDKLRPYLMENRCRICDCTAGGTFIWRDFHNTTYAVEDGVLYLKVTYPAPAFAPPRGKNASRESYDRILEYCSENDMKPLLRSVSEADLKRILEMFPGSEVINNRNWSDYLYHSSDLMHLDGRKFAGQRNHINRFLREYPDWSFERISDDNIDSARKYVEKFAREFKKDAAVYMEGNRKALEVLDNLELYGQFGGVLFVAREVVGVSLGEIMGDTLFIHAEKADTTYYGSYPMLMNQFALCFSTEDIIYINREEDDGVEGLRKSKMSYHPIELLNKYFVELKQLHNA